MLRLVAENVLHADRMDDISLADADAALRAIDAIDRWRFANRKR